LEWIDLKINACQKGRGCLTATTPSFLGKLTLIRGIHSPKIYKRTLLLRMGWLHLPKLEIKADKKNPLFEAMSDPSIRRFSFPVIVFLLRIWL